MKDGRLLLDISGDKESVAELMQCHINGEAAVINGECYLVADIKNEIIGGKVISIFPPLALASVNGPGGFLATTKKKVDQLIV